MQKHFCIFFFEKVEIVSEELGVLFSKAPGGCFLEKHFQLLSMCLLPGSAT